MDDAKHMAPTVIGYFQRALNRPLLQKILSAEEPPTTVDGWYKKAVQFNNNYQQMQVVLGFNHLHTSHPIGNFPSKKKFQFKKREPDPNTMDVDTMTYNNQLIEEEHLSPNLLCQLEKPTDTI